eukprot:m.20073 g.20073  ORF g.20073 m.20073 type:complete len:81 (-) comp5212_c0_seq1:621-863(-)
MLSLLFYPLRSIIKTTMTTSMRHCGPQYQRYCLLWQTLHFFSTACTQPTKDRSSNATHAYPCVFVDHSVNEALFTVTLYS